MSQAPYNSKLNLFEITRFDCIYILYFSGMCPFSILPNMAGFPVIWIISDITEFLEQAKLQIPALSVIAINVSRHKRISKQKALLEKHKTGVQTGIRVENRGPTFC